MPTLALKLKLVVGAMAVAHGRASNELPNVVIVLADDIGPGDVGVYHRERTGNPNTPVPTPNLDRLVREGIRFDDAHSPASVCAPSRFSMITGCYSYRNYKASGVWDPTESTGVEQGSFASIGRIAQSAGYATAFFGKSGMGGGFAPAGPSDTYPHLKEALPNPVSARIESLMQVDMSNRTSGPNQLGFDYSYELPSGIQNSPLAYYENGQWEPQATESTWGVAREQSMSSTPTLAAPSSPGVDRAAQDKIKISDSHWSAQEAGWKLSEKAKSYISRQTSDSPGQPMFIYYWSQAVHTPHKPPVELDGVPIRGTTVTPHTDMVRELDVQVGVLIKALESAAILEDTLFIFTSDNGGMAPHHMSARYAEAEKKASYDSTNGWRDFKGSIFEGGHRVPLVARWPGIIPPNSRSEELVSAMDVVATIAEITEQQPLSQRLALDSKSLLPLFKKEAGASGHDALVHYRGDEVALRQGDWKLHATLQELEYDAASMRHTAVKGVVGKNLFNLRENPAELPTKDYIDDATPENAQRVRRMVAMIYKAFSGPTVSTSFDEYLYFNTTSTDEPDSCVTRRGMYKSQPKTCIKADRRDV